MIDRDGCGHSYSDVRGEIHGSSEDDQLRKHLPRTFSLISELKSGERKGSDTPVVLLTINDTDSGSADVIFL